MSERRAQVGGAESLTDGRDAETPPIAIARARRDCLSGALKDQYDPGNLFRLNQNIKPSKPAAESALAEQVAAS